MTPITRHEVEEARNKEIGEPRRFALDTEALKFLAKQDLDYHITFYMRLGYEIARQRVERGEEP